jgi:hypothetical protein
MPTWLKMFNPAEQSAEKCRKQKKRKKTATFPAQALSCSGSTGIISASPSAYSWTGQHPGNLRKPVFPPAIQI